VGQSEDCFDAHFALSPILVSSCVYSMARTGFFRIPENIRNPVVLIEGTSARIVDFDEARRLADDSHGRNPTARWLNSKEIRSNRGRIVVQRCERNPDCSGHRGLSLTMSPATPISRHGGDFRSSRYHKLLDDFAARRLSATEFMELGRIVLTEPTDKEKELFEKVFVPDGYTNLVMGISIDRSNKNNGTGGSDGKRQRTSSNSSCKDQIGTQLRVGSKSSGKDKSVAVSS
jgi:hypothetical protein